MGALTSRQNGGVEEVDIISNHAYKYPPRSGSYFGSHFIMGGERFDTPQPESYLFGENSDLNFLGCRPTPIGIFQFPYPPPQPSEPTKTLKSLVNIRKESLRFVRAPADCCKVGLYKDNGHDLRNVEMGKGSAFNIEFTFDSDVRCAITIYYFCTEEYTPSGVTYIPKDPKMTSETFRYNKGANQQFCQMTHIFDPSKYTEDELLYDVDREIIPITIHCVADEGPEDMRQSHTTIATAEKCADGTFVLKALKQKLFVDGLCYLLQEIYGIENKNNDRQSGDDETEDNGSECVICMCDVRDTLILPCRHLCLCNACADSLRYQANNCPICRAPFRALLQIRALQKCISNNPSNNNLSPLLPSSDSCDIIPPGYEAVSLIEALNGPCMPAARQPPAAIMPDLVETPDSEHAIQAAQILNRAGGDRSPVKSNSPATVKDYNLMTNREQDDNKCPLLSIGDKQSPRNKHIRNRDSVKLINEKTVTFEKDENNDDDSEAEKLSPLLQNIKETTNLTLSMTDIVEPIDDTDNEDAPTIPEKPKNYGGDESDYYTPEEPAPNSGPLYETTTNVSSVDSTPQRLPGTPLSHASGRSSGDSYSSGSSTRHLLAVVNGNANEKVVHI